MYCNALYELSPAKVTKFTASWTKSIAKVMNYSKLQESVKKVISKLRLLTLPVYIPALAHGY